MVTQVVPISVYPTICLPHKRGFLLEHEKAFVQVFGSECGSLGETS